MHTETATGRLSFMDRYAWPLGIVIALGLFIGMTVYYVKRAFSERVDLVAVDYYYRDKAFSERLTREKNLLRRGEIDFILSGDTVRIRLPEYFADKKISGTLSFYSPLNPADDFSLPVNFFGKQATLPARTDTRKAWRVALDFTAGGDGFFRERLIRGK